MSDLCDNLQRVRARVDRRRIVETALALCGVYSPTGRAGEVSDRLAALLSSEGFTVERPAGGHPAAPAVVVRWSSGRPGRTLQFDGHLDTVHLPFVSPRDEGDRLTGSGSADMKSGVAAAVEALRVIRELELLASGSILFVAHDLHEAPWGDGSQLTNLIREGYVGDAVLIPEYLRDVLAVVGRGQAVIKMTVRRPGAPVHEVMRPVEEPNVIAAGAELVRWLMEWNAQLAVRRDPDAGSESVFVGQIHSGEIYNQYPQELWLEGTRRWLPGRKRAEVEADYRTLLADVARETGATIEGSFFLVRDAFKLPVEDPLVASFEAARAARGDAALPRGGKPFVDDGNTFWAEGQVAAITHGPQGGGAHTLQEWVSVDDLVRVAEIYALTAAAYCA